jgi:hypothetical protein
MEKFYTLKEAVEMTGSKENLSERCRVSPSMVGKAFIEEKTRGWRVRVTDGIWELVRPQEKWKVSVSKDQKPGKRTRNY